ncbi:DNA-binding NarL/FixJ family response regulator [Thermocatellispora tengchongensis]|uniref:DNA-binding NarL/FixJ family response regulator n=1 Tax=Thermocatellispora tengchongensis TaxID=1073253 RepID=A0A840P576_9ACTN|nr:response regulator transcription factor [Thermocatellispora tengchongensis]MBB5134502.1 DNA-binding NarL/FixJ family response regulator [Thermocatellispora tengchongensis]
MDKTAGVRVLLVDDDPLVRAGLRIILDDPPALQVVGEAADGSQVPAAVETHAPHVVLMDIRMPGLDGLSAAELLRRHPAAPEIILLTAFHADEYVLRALRAGASGFLLKDTPPAEILRAVTRVAAGEPFLSPAVLRQVITHVGDTGAGGRRQYARSLLSRLTEREQAVAVALGQGKSNAEIGEELFLSVATVKAHVSNMLTKLDLNNRTQIALLAHDAELTG